jgi:hypothetical protein
MVAGETANPRRVIPRAYKTIIYRILGIYVFSALAVSRQTGQHALSLMTGWYQCPLQRCSIARRYCCRSSGSRKIAIRHQHEPTRYSSSARLGQRHCPHFRLLHRLFLPLRL